MPTPVNRLSIEYRPYRRSFAYPLETAWGQWSVREGYLIRVKSGNGQAGLGEVAPLEEFGTESVKDAGFFLKSLPASPERHEFDEILAQAPPACGFGLWSARQQTGSTIEPIRTAALMNLDKMDASIMEEARDSGYTTFKVKLGLGKPEQEWLRLREVASLLRNGEKLRLDPNRAWDLEVYEFWVQRLPDLGSPPEFIEEPIQPGLVGAEALVEIATRSPVPLALDESLSEDGIAKWLDLRWPGYWIVKPSLCGIPIWMDQLRGVQNRIVISSAFETAVGINHLLGIANAYPDTVHGLGTGAFFNDALSHPSSGGHLHQQESTQLNTLWKSLLKD